MLSLLHRNKEAREYAIKVITEDKALEQFGTEEVKQKVENLPATCGGEQNKIYDLHDHDPFCTTTGLLA
jgi:hypothetical protein